MEEHARDRVTDQTRMAAGVVVGALVGGLTAYFVFTSPGRGALASVDSTLDEVSRALQTVRRALRKADGVAHEATGAVEDVRAVLAGHGFPADG